MCFEFEERADDHDGHEVSACIAVVSVNLESILLQSDEVKQYGSYDLVVKGRDVDLLFIDLAHELPQRLAAP